MISEGLKCNSTLTTLDLRCNEKGREDIEEMNKEIKERRNVDEILIMIY